jgi:hypothetical protein
MSPGSKSLTYAFFAWLRRLCAHLGDLIKNNLSEFNPKVKNAGTIFDSKKFIGRHYATLLGLLAVVLIPVLAGKLGRPVPRLICSSINVDRFIVRPFPQSRTLKG